MRVDDSTIYRSAKGREALADLYSQQLAAWPVTTRSLTVQTGYGDTHVLLAGDDDAPPLLLFHAWGASAASLYLHYDLECLAARFRLVMPDIVGQPGRSAVTRPALPDNYGVWAAELMDALAIQQAFAVGSGGGGTLALSLAAHVPDRVIRVLVVSPDTLTALAVPSARMLAATLPLRLHPTRAGARRYIRALSAGSHPQTAAHDHVARQTALAAEHVRPFAPPQLDATMLAQVRAPVYVLLGADDPTMRAQAAADRMEALVLNAETETVAGLAHLVTLDAPGLVESRILRFFGQLG